MDNSEGSIEFKIKSEELIIKDEVDDPAYELTTTEESNDLSDDDDKTKELMSVENKLTVKEEDDFEGSVAFKIKVEELCIKDEVDDPAYVVATTEENSDWSEDQRQFVIIKSDVGPPHHIFDRFANILIKVDSSLCCTKGLSKILTCSVGLVNLLQKRDVNEPPNSAALVAQVKKDLINVQSVRRNLVKTAALEGTCSCMRVKDHINVKSAKKDLLKRTS